MYCFFATGLRNLVEFAVRTLHVLVQLLLLHDCVYFNFHHQSSFRVVVFAFVCFVNTVFFESLDNHYIKGGSI